MLIGELASATGVSARTLRFYEGQGLLRDPGRTEAGYREYPPEAVGRVRFIRRAASAGLTLRQIAEVLHVRDEGQAPCSHVEGFVEQRLAEVEARMDELRELRGQLTALRLRVSVTDPDDCPAEAVCSAVEHG